MSRNRILGLMFLVVGIMLFAFGLHASHSPGERLYETVTGRFTDTTNWLIMGGGAAMLIGVVLTVVGGKRVTD